MSYEQQLDWAVTAWLGLSGVAVFAMIGFAAYRERKAREKRLSAFSRRR